MCIVKCEIVIMLMVYKQSTEKKKVGAIFFVILFMLSYQYSLSQAISVQP